MSGNFGEIQSMDMHELQLRIKMHGLMLCLEKYVELAEVGGEVHRVQMASILERLSHCTAPAACPPPSLPPHCARSSIFD